MIDPYRGTGAVSRPDLPTYQIVPVCAAPGCDKVPDDPHEVWSRANAGGFTSWVEVDGRWVGNRVGLCRPHHEAVTGEIGGHKAAITYDAETHGLIWLDLVERTAARLDPHPPITELSDETGSDDKTVERARKATEAARTRAEETLAFVPVAAAESVSGPHTHREEGEFFSADPLDLVHELAEAPAEIPAGEVCPTCHRRKPKKTTHRDIDPENPYRGRKTWTIAVPKDKLEDGVAVIELNLQALATSMGLYDEETGKWAPYGKFRTLGDGLAWMAVNYTAEGEE